MAPDVSLIGWPEDPVSAQRADEQAVTLPIGDGRSGRRAGRISKVSERIARHIATDILQRGFRPGHRLPGEKEMALQLGVGRTTLREALRLLEVQGIVTIKAGPGGGPVVQRPTSERITDHLALILQFQDATFGQVIEARAAIEVLIAEVAAPSATESDIELLQRSIDLVRSRPDDHPLFLEQNAVFHAGVAGCTRNPVFRLFVESLKSISDGTPIGVLYSRHRRLRVAQLHEDIVAGLADRDPQAARAAMQQHMSEFQRYVEKEFPELLGKPIRWPGHLP